jgi:ferredoxin
MSALRVTIDRERCDGCWACVRSCPSAALESRATASAAEILWDAGRCLFCGRCEVVCPKQAVCRASPLERVNKTVELDVLVQLPAWACTRCGTRFGAGTRRSDLTLVVEAIEGGRLLLCPRCRQSEAFRTGLAGRGEGD